MPRGGRRPGAGAPMGNLNALKHGLRSKQVQQLAREFARSPAMRSYLARLQRLAQQRRLSHTAQQTASLAVAVWLRYLRALQQGQPWDGPVPPPFSYREARAVGKRLAHQIIEQGLANQIHKARKT